MITATVVTLIVRYRLVMLFLPFSVLDKLLGFKSAVRQAQEVFKPRVVADLVLICGLRIEVIMSLGVVTGFADRMAALIMAAYCCDSDSRQAVLGSGATSGPPAIAGDARSSGISSRTFRSERAFS